ncbi:hypothetical protein ABW20_dc0102247 [Dactylellina cionopaga]|nr:hypothetical protein ABW20_dc0102247 [Dactylellina cionopaga]
MTRDSSSPTLINREGIRAVRTPDFAQSWGHNYMVSQHVQEYGTPLTLDSLIQHMELVGPLLERWDVEIDDILVDEARMTATAKGEEKEAVGNDMVWILEMDKEGTKVKKAIEFHDSVAAARIKQTLLP